MDELVVGECEGWLVRISINHVKQVGEVLDQIQLVIRIAWDRNDQIFSTKLVGLAEVTININNIVDFVNLNVPPTESLLIRWFRRFRTYILLSEQAEKNHEEGTP